MTYIIATLCFILGFCTCATITGFRINAKNEQLRLENEKLLKRTLIHDYIQRERRRTKLKRVASRKLNNATCEKDICDGSCEKHTIKTIKVRKK